MSLEKIQQALIGPFTSFLQSGDIVQWPNTIIKPPAALRWFMWHWKPASEHITTIGPNGVDEANGFVQIDCMYPSGAGEGDSRKTIEKLRTCFSPRVLVFQGQQVTILSRTQSPALQSNGYYKVPFTIRWRAKLDRP